jgi:hypothetical protein
MKMYVARDKLFGCLMLHESEPYQAHQQWHSTGCLEIKDEKLLDTFKDLRYGSGFVEVFVMIELPEKEAIADAL